LSVTIYFFYSDFSLSFIIGAVVRLTQSRIKQIFFDKPDYLLNEELHDMNADGLITENKNFFFFINRITFKRGTTWYECRWFNNWKQIFFDKPDYLLNEELHDMNADGLITTVSLSKDLEIILPITTVSLVKDLNKVSYLGFFNVYCFYFSSVESVSL
jgi:hypothetical protein